MPMAPRNMATVAAMMSMMRVKDVLLMDWSVNSLTVLTSARGRFGFTDHMASRTSLKNPAVWTLSLLTAKRMVRRNWSSDCSPGSPVHTFGVSMGQ